MWIRSRRTFGMTSRLTLCCGESSFRGESETRTFIGDGQVAKGCVRQTSSPIRKAFYTGSRKHGSRPEVLIQLSGERQAADVGNAGELAHPVTSELLCHRDLRNPLAFWNIKASTHPPHSTALFTTPSKHLDQHVFFERPAC